MHLSFPSHPIPIIMVINTYVHILIDVPIHNFGMLAQSIELFEKVLVNEFAVKNKRL